MRMHDTIEVRYSVENVQRSNAADASDAPSSKSTSAEIPAMSNTLFQMRDGPLAAGRVAVDGAVVVHVEDARQRLGPLDVAAHPVQRFGNA